MYVVDEKDFEYRHGDNGPKYLMRGPRMNFALVQIMPGRPFDCHYHSVMEENFFILEGEPDMVVDGVVNRLRPGQMIHLEPGEAHYILNRGTVPVKMVAVLAPYQEQDKTVVENPQV